MKESDIELGVEYAKTARSTKNAPLTLKTGAQQVAASARLLNPDDDNAAYHAALDAIREQFGVITPPIR